MASPSVMPLRKPPLRLNLITDARMPPAYSRCPIRESERDMLRDIDRESEREREALRRRVYPPPY